MDNAGKSGEIKYGRADWRWQDRHAVVNARELSEFLNLKPADAARIARAAALQPLKITPYYLSLMERDNPADPLRRMVVPDARELRISSGESADPIGDAGRFQPVPGVTHRHSDRALIYPAMHCAGYCRYCFRRRRVDAHAQPWRPGVERRALAYIGAHSEIKEVIVTGGEPLMLPDEQLLALLRRLRRIPHVRLVRLHTRMPAFNPFRITRRLAAGLAALQPLWVVVHFNHAREITPIAELFLRRLRRAAPLLNQSVLLRGVNDSVPVLRALCWRLAEVGVKPYYLHHPDRAEGTRHFRPALRSGVRLWRELSRAMPGYLIPKYVLDIPEGAGKTPLCGKYDKSGDRRRFVRTG